MSDRLGVIHLPAVLETVTPVCRAELGPNDRIGEEREGDCPECLAIRGGRDLRVYVGGRRVICYSTCWGCKFDQHDSGWHSWAGFEDVEHAANTGQADPSDQQCGCYCQRGVA